MTEKLPSLQFYPADWVRDTRCLSLAAKGAWIDLLCAMWNSQTRGKLSLPIVGLARLISASVDQAEAVLSELTDMQILNYERNSNGIVTLSCRRMVRDEETRKSNRLRVARHRESIKKRLGNEDVPTRARTEDEDAENGFVLFWESYPRKTAKAKALEAWDKLNPGKELRAQIMLAVEQQKHSAQWLRDEGQYVPYAATWLNGARWLDTVTPNGRGPVAPPDPTCTRCGLVETVHRGERNPAKDLWGCEGFQC